MRYYSIHQAAAKETHIYDMQGNLRGGRLGANEIV